MATNSKKTEIFIMSGIKVLKHHFLPAATFPSANCVPLLIALLLHLTFTFMSQFQVRALFIPIFFHECIFTFAFERTRHI